MRRILLSLIAMATLMTALLSLAAGPAAADAPQGAWRVAQASGEAAAPPTDAPRIANPPPAPPPQPARVEAGEDAQLTYKTPWEVYLIAMTMALGFMFIGLFCWIFWKKGANETFLRYFVILTVIFAALFLIVAGYSEKQTAPVFGLLGTIAGYIFGRVSSQPDESRERRQQGGGP